MANDRRAPRQPPPQSSTSGQAPGLQELLTTMPGLRGAMISSYDGELQLRAGDIDAETAAAVIAMALRPIWKACEEIGLGPPVNWSATLGDESWYVSHGEREVVTVVGDALDNPEATMHKLVAVLEGVLS